MVPRLCSISTFWWSPVQTANRSPNKLKFSLLGFSLLKDTQLSYAKHSEKNVKP